MLKTILTTFIILHGLVHTILAMVPNPRTPEPRFADFFPGFGSKLLARLGFSESATKTSAIVLSVVATLGFVATGLARWSILVPFDWWRALAIGSAAVSLFLLVIFWDLYLIVGLLIDITILATLLLTKGSSG